jgi:hypothetical protein
VTQEVKIKTDPLPADEETEASDFEEEAGAAPLMVESKYLVFSTCSC